jgi:hypothetical protein
MIPVDATLRRPASFPFSGRLIALPTSRSLAVGQTLDLIDQISIDFPAMPDSIELARSAEYQVLSNVILPDGVHQYKGTRPLEIPFSFRLHAFDQDYCPNGSYSLLQLAARLHSFILPIDTSGGNVSITAQAGVSASNTEGQQEAKAVAPDGGLGFAHIGGEKIFNPVTLRLELIFTGQTTPGIACTGYVREVNVKLNGPWLRGPGKSSNLPSSGDFSFVFVHRPGHGNRFNINTTNLDTQPQAYAQTVKEKFYNTRSLVQVANYQGLNDAAGGGITSLPEQTTGSRIRLQSTQGANIINLTP